MSLGVGHKRPSRRPAGRRRIRGGTADAQGYDRPRRRLHENLAGGGLGGDREDDRALVAAAERAPAGAVLPGPPAVLDRRGVAEVFRRAAGAGGGGGSDMRKPTRGYIVVERG